MNSSQVLHGDEFTAYSTSGKRFFFDGDTRYIFIAGYLQGFTLISLEVPVVAIVTKFDTFLQDVQQKLEESAEKEDQEVDDDEVEKLAEIQADMQFEQHYKGPLYDMKHPPKAVVALSEGKMLLASCSGDD